MSPGPTDFHLALEAVVAYVDGELRSGAGARAATHVAACRQCSRDVAAQREAKLLLVAAGRPDLPGDLLSRLHEIPFTTDLRTPPMDLVMHGENLQWTGSGTQPPCTGPAYQVPPDRRPPGRAESGTGPATRQSGRSLIRLRRLRRGLVGAVAGLAVGVLAASVVPATVAVGSGTAQIPGVERQRAPEVSTALVGSFDSVQGGDFARGDLRTGEVRTGEVRTGEVRSGDVRSGDVRSGDVRTGEVARGDERTGDVTPSRGRRGQATGPLSGFGR